MCTGRLSFKVVVFQNRANFFVRNAEYSPGWPFHSTTHARRLYAVGRAWRRGVARR